MKFVLVAIFFEFLCFSHCYYERSDKACIYMFQNCDKNGPECHRMYQDYMSNCENLFSDPGATCSKKCKAPLTKLMSHPIFSSFSECDCRNKVDCVKQKCAIIECMDEECSDVIPTTPVPEKRPTTTTRNPWTNTMGTSTVSLTAEVNCETVIIQCSRISECWQLTRARDEACHTYGYGPLSEECSADCIAANTALRSDIVGRHMSTCIYETRNRDTFRLTNLMRYCVEPLKSQTPTVPTPIPDRPVGDCKRAFDECNDDDHCSRAFNVLMKTCKRSHNGGKQFSTCTEECSSRIDDFIALKKGRSLWDCSCETSPVSRKCDDILHKFNDICNNEPCKDFLAQLECNSCRYEQECSEHCAMLCKKTCGICAYVSTSEPTTPMPQPLSTMDESYPSSEVTTQHPTNSKDNFYNVSVHCEDRINVRIIYTSDSDYIPTFTAQDHSCKADGTPPILHLEYNPKKCGTKREKTKDAKYAFKNSIYVLSADMSYREQIASVECTPKPHHTDNDTEEEAEEVSMSFFSDNEYSAAFSYKVERDATPGVSAVLDLEDNKTVYVQLDSRSKHGSFVVDSCYATPQRHSNYSTPYFLLQNGCRKDESLNFDEFKPGGRARFSFSRMKFEDERFSGKVYIHCSLMLCDKSEPGCRIRCRNHAQNEHFARLTVSEGPYTFKSRGDTQAPISYLIIVMVFLLTMR